MSDIPYAPISWAAQDVEETINGQEVHNFIYKETAWFSEKNDGGLQICRGSYIFSDLDKLRVYPGCYNHGIFPIKVDGFQRLHWHIFTAFLCFEITRAITQQESANNMKLSGIVSNIYLYVPSSEHVFTIICVQRVINSSLTRYNIT